MLNLHFNRNQQDVASDIDVIVIGNPKGAILAEVIRSLEHQLGREINYTVLTRKEFDSRRARKDAFLEDIWHNERFSLVGPARRNPNHTRSCAGKTELTQMAIPASARACAEARSRATSLLN